MAIPPVKNLDVALDRDVFLRNLLRELSGTLEELIGLEEASGYISIVGQKIADWINEDYRNASQLETLPVEMLAQVLVDLKDRIDGGFSLVSLDDEKIVLTNNRCPFGNSVVGRRSLCMMTSTVFGTLTADNLGYAKVVLRETIAAGDKCCNVIVYLKPPTNADALNGIEYFSA